MRELSTIDGRGVDVLNCNANLTEIESCNTGRCPGIESVFH